MRHYNDSIIKIKHDFMLLKKHGAFNFNENEMLIAEPDTEIELKVDVDKLADFYGHPDCYKFKSKINIKFRKDILGA